MFTAAVSGGIPSCPVTPNHETTVIWQKRVPTTSKFPHRICENLEGHTGRGWGSDHPPPDP